MSDFQHTAEAYIAVWNETDAAARRALIAELFTEGVRYTDPLGDVQGHDGVDAFIAGAQAQFAGLVFSLAGDADGHHDTARFTWHLGAPGSDEPLAIGFDVVDVEAGRITHVHGFLDKVPS
jgi:SnoaL-like domain